MEKFIEKISKEELLKEYGKLWNDITQKENYPQNKLNRILEMERELTIREEQL